jgi:hypothetical protein
MAECQHDEMTPLFGALYECVECGFQTEFSAADFGGPDTMKEARGEA